MTSVFSGAADSAINISTEKWPELAGRSTPLLRICGVQSHEIISFVSALGLAVLLVGAGACEELRIVATEHSGTEYPSEGDSLTDSGEEFPTEPSTETESSTHTEVTTETESASDTSSESDTESIVDTETATDTESTADTEPPVCANASGIPVSGSRSVTVGATARSYFLHVPLTYTGKSPVPVIFDFHAIGGVGAAQAANSPFPSVTDAEEVIMAFPDGLSGMLGTAWNIGGCCVDGADDIQLVQTIVDDLKSVACIDQSRIYAVGISMGGGLVHHLGCQSANVVAAIAPVGFDLLQDNIAGCIPSRPIAVAFYRGTQDPFISYEGGYSDVVPGHPITLLGAENTFEKWAELDGCTGSAGDFGNGCRGYSAAQCMDGVEVRFCADQPGALISSSDATSIWEFFKRHPKP